ncbi:MAG TPA: HisA/HisF-related TIM barrel protein [Burkholderiaceae bacterium]|nr:HisA/HisF-related TIM barrel protein [Burkholderiaceae bacterium]
MKLVPVIDLAAGTVVRAVRGERERYRPIVSRLCEGHDPADVAVALAAYCAADTLYLADLDAIRGGALQQAALARIAAALPACRLWLDAGFARVRDADGVRTDNIEPVFGSESLADESELARLRGRSDVLLSLDQRGGVPMDPAGCWRREDCWPDRVIVMTLDRVGAGSGPDLATLAAVRQRAGGRTVIGAGGIRSADDLRAAQEAGAAAWLVASALHDMAIPPMRHPQ